MQVGMISSRQFFYLMFSIVAGLTVQASQSLAEQARQDAWLSLLVAAAIAIAVGWALWNLGLRFPGRTLIEYAPRVLGTWPGKLVGLLYIWLFVHAHALTLRNMAGFLNVFMPETPIPVLAGVTAVVCSYGAYMGLEVVARTAEITGPVAIAIAVILPAAIWGKMDLGNLLPVLERGMGRPLFAAMSAASWYGLCIAMGMLMAYHNEPRRALLAKASGVLAGTAALTATMMAAIATLGPNVTARQILPIFVTARRVEIWRFIERIEVLIVALALLLVFVTTAALQNLSAAGLAQWLGLTAHRPLVLPLGLISTALALGLESRVELVRFLLDGFPLYALAIEGGLTFLLLAVAAARGLRQAGQDAARRGQGRPGIR